MNDSDGLRAIVGPVPLHGNMGSDINSVTSIGIVHRECRLSEVIILMTCRRAGQRVTFKLLASLIAIVMSAGLKLQKDMLGNSYRRISVDQ